MIYGLGLGFSIVSFILLITCMLLIFKIKDKDINDLYNVLLVGMFFILVVSFVDFLFYLNEFGWFGFLSWIDYEMLFNGLRLVVIPLASLCFLVAIFILKEH